MAATTTRDVESTENNPVVTLSHGGQLQGLSNTFQDVQVDIFLGIRYAKPPVGKLRFKKPEKLPPWQGIKEAVTFGNSCSQLEIGDEGLKLGGSEDCLFMDITVPGGVQTAKKKPVMMFMHGGAYQKGAKNAYIGAPLAVIGDVIVVTINYRLGIFGFLTDDKPGTGNFGLWDQRAALVWIKENIEQFGGDPELVTIFGESAGAGSVAALAMGQHNDGLFKRGIMQSGSLFQPWGWFLEPDNQEDIKRKLRELSGCPSSTQSIYECLQDMPAEAIFSCLGDVVDLYSPFRPVADGDFFAEDINVHSYKPAERFDLMMGFNGNEGLAFYMYLVVMHNHAAFMGLDANATRKFITEQCSTYITPYSPNLCVQYIYETYKIDEATDDQDRARRVIEFIGDHLANVDIVFALEQHSSGSKSTYAYHFTERFTPAPDAQLWPIPEWAKTSADHTVELNFIFGSAFLHNDQWNSWREKIIKERNGAKAALGATEDDKELSRTMILMWSNFAKSGNPNEPIKLPVDIPTWPEFNTETNRFLEINSKGSQVITTPNKERMHKMRQLLYADRELQRELSKKFSCPKEEWPNKHSKL